MAKNGTGSKYGTNSPWGFGEFNGECLLVIQEMPSQFDNSDELQKHLCIYAFRQQKFNDTLQQIKFAYDIDNANGAQLDAIGERVITKRQGTDDDLYRTILRVRTTQVLPSSGTAEEIIRIFRELLGPGRSIRYVEFFPAGFLIFAEFLTKQEALVFPQLLKDSRAGGVDAQLGVTPNNALIIESSTNPIPVTTFIASSTFPNAVKDGNISGTVPV